MIQSKFKSDIYLVLPFIAVLAALLILLLFSEPNTLIVEKILILFLNYICIYGAIKTQKITIQNNEIIVKGGLGWGIKKKFTLKDISGYYTGNYKFRTMNDPIAYITIHDKKIARLSKGTHKNFAELLFFLESNLTYLGPLKITHISEYQSLINPKNKLKT